MKNQTLQSMLRTIQYLEQYLFEEITLEQAAEYVHYSKFHFCRMFKAISGENPGDYQRKRRLTVAAEQLLNSEEGVLTIAVACGYQSQEAFTRVFKDYFGVTPAAYRKKGIPFFNLYKYPLEQADLEAILPVDGLPAYQIQHKDGFVITGLSYHGKNERHDVARVFNQAVTALHFDQIYSNIDGLYGLDYSEEPGQEEDVIYRRSDFDFVAGVDQKYLLPEDRTNPELTSKVLPAADYAVFALTPIIEKIPMQVRNIYLGILESNQIQLTDSYGFEFYPHDFVPNQKDSKAYLYLPVSRSE